MAPSSAWTAVSWSGRRRGVAASDVPSLEARAATLQGHVVRSLQQRRARLLSEMRVDLAALDRAYELSVTTGVYQAEAFPVRLRWLANLARSDDAWRLYATPDDLLPLRSHLQQFIAKVEDGGQLDTLLEAAEAAVERLRTNAPGTPERTAAVERWRRAIEEGVSAARRVIVPMEHARS